MGYLAHNMEEGSAEDLQCLRRTISEAKSSAALGGEMVIVIALSLKNELATTPRDATSLIDAPVAVQRS